ncbi:hypothetical protein [Sphingosinicella sp.]
MRLRAGIVILLLALAGCAHRPERLTIEIDDYRVEIGKKEPAGGE